ncbi:hypothetical protein [Paenibacillus sp. UASWS1643]|uniref:hypothetical protein n=1 Tax=Paenibacillus sp. UASWS1643 TaxID=2580422 RepID=UPI0016867C56|nr:hypothetical protein [Paenibacillus sp. UASWS1643]
MAETIGLLSKIKRAYPNFTLITNKDGQGRVVSSPTAEIWHERLSLNGITLNEALEALNTHIDNVHFEPTISDILKGKKQLSVYDQQAIEHKELMLSIETPENECVPMPDAVERAIDQMGSRMSATRFGGDDIDD